MAHSARGNVLWTAWEIRGPDGAPLTRFIGCDLLARSGDGWGYKDMEESSGPCYYTCPLAYLEMVPPPDPEKHPYAAGWREKVRAYHAERATARGTMAALKVGDRLALKGTPLPAVTVVQVRPLRGRADNGTIYRIPSRFVGEVLA